ncbi:MAG: hypothetical protein KUG76_00520 [Gammaproteobacteria bacterium]|nr:hypothetical protein [Gammaproteobacteria bacterium]
MATESKDSSYPSGRSQANAIELFDHGLEQSCVVLSELTQKKTNVTVVALDRLSRAEAFHTLSGSSQVSVAQTFQGDSPGMVLLHGEAYHYLQAMTGLVSKADFEVALDNDIVCELGNIILNGILRTVSILTQNRLYCSQPNRLSVELVRRFFSGSGIYKSDVFSFELDFSWIEEEVSFSIPLKIQLHFGASSDFNDWEGRVYGPKGTGGE